MESLLTTALCGYARIMPEPALEIRHANGTLAAWLGYETAELAHQPLERLLDRASWAALRDEILPHAEAQGSRFPVQASVVLVTRGGEKMPAQISLAMDPAGSGQALAIFLRTPPKPEKPGPSLSELSHELRSPLQSISLTTYVLLDEDQGPINEEQRADLQRIQRAAQEVSRLVNEILARVR